MTVTETAMCEESVPMITERNDDLRIVLSRPADLDDAIVVKLAGRVDFYNSRYFGRQIRNLLRAGETRFVLDFAAITYFSSTGVAELMGFHKEVSMSAGRIVLARAGTGVIDVLSLLGFAGFFETATTVPEAVEILKGLHPVTLFPAFRPCPVCGQKLRLTREGRFRCPECKTIVRVTGRAEIVPE